MIAAVRILRAEDANRRRLNDCDACDFGQKIARRCPLKPLEWMEVEGEVAWGWNVVEVADKLKDAVGRYNDLGKRARAGALLDLLRVRIADEARAGRYGEQHPNRCARLDLSEDRTSTRYLREVTLDDNGAVRWWVEGAQWDQPADLLDAADVIRAENARIDAERIKGARKEEEREH